MRRTFWILAVHVLEDLDVARDLLACADFAGCAIDVVRDQFVAAAGLAVDEEFSPSEARQEMQCYDVYQQRVSWML